MPPNYPADGEKLMAKVDVELDGQEPRAHPRRMDQALRRQVGSEGQVTRRRCDEAMSHLEVRNLSKRYGDFTALGDICLDIAEGEFVCFLGPSGCGKTTLLRAIAGLDPQSSGTIHQKGRDVSALPPSKRDFGIVFQSYALFPNLTVVDNVGYGLVEPAREQGGDRAARQRAAGPGRPARCRPEISRPAVRRPAAARGAGARARHLARPAAARRALVGARCARALAPAPRDQGAAANGSASPPSW